MDFIGKHVKILIKNQVTTENENSSRNFSRKYYFPIQNEEIQVCQTMFLQTIGISDKVIHNVCKKLENCTILLIDNREKHKNPPNAIAQQVKEYIRKHIRK